MIQTISHRPSYRSPVGARLLFRDLVRHHNLPSLRDASPNPDDNTASHLGDGSGLPTHNSPSGERAARSQLLFMLNHLPPAGLARTSVSSWISQSPRLDQAGKLGRAAGPAIVHVTADLAGWFGCCITSHWPAGSGLKFGSRVSPLPMPFSTLSASRTAPFSATATVLAWRTPRQVRKTARRGGRIGRRRMRTAHTGPHGQVQSWTAAMAEIGRTAHPGRRAGRQRRPSPRPGPDRSPGAAAPCGVAKSWTTTTRQRGCRASRSRPWPG